MTQSQELSTIVECDFLVAESAQQGVQPIPCNPGTEQPGRARTGVIDHYKVQE
jgi:hypothetical protein